MTSLPRFKYKYFIVKVGALGLKKFFLFNLVIEMDMAGIVIIQIIQVEVPTEIHMRVMVRYC